MNKVNEIQKPAVKYFFFVHIRVQIFLVFTKVYYVNSRKDKVSQYRILYYILYCQSVQYIINYYG